MNRVIIILIGAMIRRRFFLCRAVFKHSAYSWLTSLGSRKLTLKHISIRGGACISHMTFPVFANEVIFIDHSFSILARVMLLLSSHSWSSIPHIMFLFVIKIKAFNIMRRLIIKALKPQSILSSFTSLMFYSWSGTDSLSNSHAHTHDVSLLTWLLISFTWSYPLEIKSKLIARFSLDFNLALIYDMILVPDY